MGILPDEGSKPLVSKDHPRNKQRRNYPGGLLMSPAEIEALVGDLHVRDSRIIQYLFRMIDNAMSDLERHGLTDSDVCVIRELATAYECESYLAFMQKVVEAVEDGPEGARAAYNTLRRADDLVHDFPPDSSAMQRINEAWTRVAQSAPPPGG